MGEEKRVLRSITIDTFQSEVMTEERPVLLAYIRRDYAFKEQTGVLESIMEKHNDMLKVCLLEEDSIREFKELGINGSPVFFVFHEGKEKGRMFGKADADTLNTFLLRVLQHSEKDTCHGENTCRR